MSDLGDFALVNLHISNSRSDGSTCICKLLSAKGLFGVDTELSNLYGLLTSPRTGPNRKGGGGPEGRLTLHKSVIALRSTFQK